MIRWLIKIFAPRKRVWAKCFRCKGRGFIYYTDDSAGQCTECNGSGVALYDEEVIQARKDLLQ